MKEKNTLLEKLGRLIELAGTAVLMNLLFLVSCLPIITIGQAWCGLISAIRYNIRGDSWFQGYKDGFKKRFLRGTIVWILLLVVQGYFLLDLNHTVYQTFYATEGFTTVYIAPMVAAGLMFALSSMLTVSFLMLNVYIPTKVGTWISNAVGMVFKAPLPLLGAAVLFAAPVILAWFWSDIFLLVALIFIGFYFTLAALVITMLLKETLIDYLIDARAEGTLLSEEGKSTTKDDKEEEEYEDEEIEGE